MMFFAAAPRLCLLHRWFEVFRLHLNLQIYLIIQIPAFYEMHKNGTSDISDNAAGERSYSVVGFVVCIVAFVAYLVYQVFNFFTR